mgnify:CR=1 FL=1
MRERKFRVWNGKQMLSWHWLTAMGYVGKMLTGYFGCDKWKLMQFTDLHDKKDREIWESDIDLLFQHKYEVKLGKFQSFVSGELGNGFYLKVIGGDGRCYPMPTIEKEHEVIGNIYENPELMDVK